MARAKKSEPEPEPEPADPELTRFGGTRRAVPKYAYLGTADPDYFDRRKEVREAIRSTLELAMKARGITQKDLAVIMGVSHSAVRHRMYGRTVWQADELAVVAEKLGIEVRVFLDPDMSHRDVLAAVRPPDEE